MKKIGIMNWLLEVDVEKTAEYYRKEIEICDCSYCQNFASTVLSLEDEQISFFKNLGIMPEKPVMLSHFPTEADNNHQYIGFYHVVGRILTGETCTMTNWQDHHTYTLDKFAFCLSKENNQVPESFLEPVFQLNFETEIPWILEESGED